MSSVNVARAQLCFIRSGVDGAVWIGLATDARAKANELHRGTTRPMRVMRAVAATDADERAAHAALHAHRLSGRWFAPVAAVLAFARDYGRGRPETDRDRPATREDMLRWVRGLRATLARGGRR